MAGQAVRICNLAGFLVTGSIRLLVLACLFVSGPLLAAEWDLVTGDDYPPFTTRNAPDGGIFTIITREAFAAAGDEISLTWRPWAKGYRDTVELRNDATYPYIPTPNRLQHMLYSDPVLTLRTAIFVDHRKFPKLESLDQLSGKVYCNPQGYADNKSIDVLRKKGEITRRTPRTIGKCFDILASGQVDFVAANELMGGVIVQRMGAGAKNIVPVLMDGVKEFRLHLIVSKNHPQAEQLLRNFNNGLKKLRESGRFETLVSQYNF